MPEADVQTLKSELARSREARLRAWGALEGLRDVMVAAGQKIEKPGEKSFVREGEILKKALKKALSERNEALRDLAEAARWVDKSSFGNDSSFPQAHQALLKALDRAAQYL